MVFSVLAIKEQLFYQNDLEFLNVIFGPPSL